MRAFSIFNKKPGAAKAASGGNQLMIYWARKPEANLFFSPVFPNQTKNDLPPLLKKKIKKLFWQNHPQTRRPFQHCSAHQLTSSATRI
jgi:hypothetical protein